MQGQKNHGELGEVSYSTLDIKIVGTNAFAFIVIKEPQRKFLVEKLQRETSWKIILPCKHTNYILLNAYAFVDTYSILRIDYNAQLSNACLLIHV